MSNSNINLQTQSSNALHNAIMEAGSKDRPPMLVPVPVAEGSSETTTERYMENYKNVSQDIRDQLNASEAIQIISQDLEPIYYGSLKKFTLRDGESLKKNRSTPRFTRLMNELVRISESVTNRSSDCPVHSSATTQNAKESTEEAGYDNQWAVNDAGAREIINQKELKDAAYQQEKMLLCKQEEAGVQLNTEQADWKDDTDNEYKEQELEAHYMYMAQIQKVTPDQVDISGPIFNDEPMHKVQNNNDNYNVFAMENEHPEQPESSNDIYLAEQGDTNITIDSLDICYDRAQDEIDDLDQEREIEDFKIRIKSLESSNNHFKEANNELSKTNQLMFKDLKKFQAELDKYNDVNYASKVEIDCAKAKGDLMSYKINFEKSSNAYTRKINDLNQTISDMKKELVHIKNHLHYDTSKEAQIKLKNS
ncbi:hypothetical protein Tco_0169648 [Tanacetum coccineum]